MKSKLLILVASLIALAMIGCVTIQKAALESYVSVKAYQIGFLVGNNNPGLYDSAAPYYEKIKAAYTAVDTGDFYPLVREGINLLVNKYVPDPLYRTLIISEIKALANLLGIDGASLPADIPNIEVLEKINLEKAMAVVDEFMKGLKESS